MSDHDFDLDGLMEELASRLEETVQEAVEAAVDDLLEDRVDGAVHDAVQDILPEIFSQCLADFDFVLADTQHIQSNAHNHQSADSSHFGNHKLVQIRSYKRGQQSDGTLIYQYADCGEGNAYAKGSGQGAGSHGVDDAF